MSKKSTPNPKSPSPPKSRSTPAEQRTPKGHHKVSPEGQPQKHVLSPGAIRETIESVVVAFVLAFLFRTFEAEAFVIPTGSMAPTLMGRHKDVTCEVCKFGFQVSASDEVSDAESGIANRPLVEGVTCPMCRYSMDLGSGPEALKKHPSFNGDRILVNKFWYQFTEPKRWDVAVFKYPGGANTNFIKRVVGLPGDTIRISHGNIYVRPPGESHFTIARKPPDRLLAMLQPVFDNDLMPQIAKYGWPQRWRPLPAGNGSGAGAWKPAEDSASFETDGSAAGEAWIRYEHRVPNFKQWEEQPRVEGPLPPSLLPRPQLISDFTAYNTNVPTPTGYAVPDPEYHWVGDLALACTLDVRSESGQVVLDLVQGGRHAQCHIDVATGTATLSRDGLDSFAPTAQTAVRGPGQHEVRFSNVDDELLLWVDGKVVEFNATTTYQLPRFARPAESDLAPVGVGSRGAALRVGHLKISRDIYYIAKDSASAPFSDYVMPGVTHDVLYDPTSPAFDEMQELTRELKVDPANPAADQFLVLGDNSAKSKDGRLWGTEFYVVDRLLIGKAVFIYWPHSWDKLPGTNFPFPFFPNFARMGFVR